MPSKSSPRPAVVVALLAFVSLVGYALRTNVQVAQQYMAPELGLTDADMGIISGVGFQLAYAVFQIPTGFLGDRFGSRIVLGLAIVGWAISSFAAGLIPATAGATMAFASLFLVRLVLGFTQAATYPVGSMAIAQTVPPARRATANAIFIGAALIGSGLVPLTLAPLMVQLGWRSVFLVSGVVGLVAAAAWFLFAPPKPVADPAHRTPPLRQQLRDSWELLKDRNLLILSLAYAMEAAVFFVFVFWFFSYLVQGRGMSVLASGVWGSIPYFVAALIGPMGGFAADALGARLGLARGRRIVAMTGLFGAALLVVIGANTLNPFLAVAALSISVGCINSTEGPFWATATALGRGNPGAAGGVLNFMGNMGGVVSIVTVPLMKDAWGWTAMLGFWAGVAVVSGLLWMLVRPNEAQSAGAATLGTARS
ncbi:MAG: MFS transporter [Gemmatimonadota bacterium]